MRRFAGACDHPGVILLPASLRGRLAATLVALAVVLSACSPAITVAPSPASPSAASSSSAASPSAAASSSASTSPSASASAGEDLVALTARISSQVAALRSLPLLTPVQPDVVTEAQAVDLLRGLFQADNPPALVAAQQGLYERLGLLPAGSSLQDLELELLGSQVLGFYVPKDKKLYVVARSGGVGPVEEYTMAHEITHALQDQHFDLQRISPDPADQTDQTLGAHALIEGDASLAGTLWATRYLTLQELAVVIAAGADPSQQAVLQKLPAIVRDPLLFEYTQGLQFTLGLYRSGGWAAVDAALRSPPVSTEQVLHPASYAAHHLPVTVSLPSDLAARVGPGWRLALQDTFGALELRIWLQSSTSSSTLADQATAGCGGDRVGYLMGPDGQDAAMIWTTWDTPADAGQFLDAAGRLVADGASPGTAIRASDREVVVIVASESTLVDQVAKAAGFPR